jgi:hypothetical protein
VTSHDQTGGHMQYLHMIVLAVVVLIVLGVFVARKRGG